MTASIASLEWLAGFARSSRSARNVSLTRAPELVIAAKTESRIVIRSEY
jgi:hypothetical protein